MLENLTVLNLHGKVRYHDLQKACLFFSLFQWRLKWFSKLEEPEEVRNHKKPISCYGEGMHVGLGSDLNLDSPVQSAAYETVNSSTEEKAVQLFIFAI